MLKKSREEALSAQKSLEKQLNSEMDLCNELQVKLERTSERKDELKTELGEARRAYDELVAKWKEKSELITELEARVRQMRESFESREREATERADKLVVENQDLTALLRKCDDDFRRQYDVERCEHVRQVERVRGEYEAKLAAGEVRVREIEDEMRLVLADSEKSKRFYEEKIESFSHLFAKFQSEIVAKQDR
jgi:chromosome segregation ATPase